MKTRICLLEFVNKADMTAVQCDAQAQCELQFL